MDTDETARESIKRLMQDEDFKEYTQKMEVGVQTEETESPIARNIGLVSAVLALLAPAYLILYQSGQFGYVVNIWSMQWLIFFHIIEPGALNFILNPFFVIAQSWQYTFLRPVFVVQMIRYYLGKSSRRATLLTSLFCELPVVILSVPTYLNILLNPSTFYMIALPLPTLLLFGWILLRFVPIPQKRKDWVEIEDKSQWWGQSVDKVDESG